MDAFGVSSTRAATRNEVIDEWYSGQKMEP